MMRKFEVFLKDGTSHYTESKWVNILTVDSMLDNSKHFIMIGDKIFAKDFIASIHELGTTEE